MTPSALTVSLPQKGLEATAVAVTVLTALVIKISDNG
jgi:hypothetical protein